ncbi:MAG: hypothetical protein L6R39_006183, partial [Caloplaca ligustica]
TLRPRLIHPFPAVDFAHERDIQHDAQHIEVNKEAFGDADVVPSSGGSGGRIISGDGSGERGRRKKHPCRGANIQDRNGEFLERENNKLNPFVNIIHPQKYTGIRAVRAERQHRGRDLEGAEIEYDDDEHRSQDARVADHEVEARVQDEALAGDHAPPAEGGEGGVDVPGAGADEPFEDDAEGVGDDAPGGDEERPEVDCVAAFEGGEDFEIDDQGHVDG